MKARKMVPFVMACCMSVCVFGCAGKESKEVKNTEILEVANTENSMPASIITEEGAENITEIQYHLSDSKRYIVSDKAAIQELAHEISKIQLTEENAIPEDDWFEGGRIVELIMENGETIEFGCGSEYIGFGKQYYVDNDWGKTIIEKGVCVEENTTDSTK